MRAELQPLIAIIQALPAEELPRLLGDLEELRAIAQVRLLTPPRAPSPDEMLDVNQAADRMRISVDQLYSMAKKLPFTRHIGRKLVFSSAGLDAFLKHSK